MSFQLAGTFLGGHYLSSFLMEATVRSTMRKKTQIKATSRGRGQQCFSVCRNICIWLSWTEQGWITHGFHVHWSISDVFDVLRRRNILLFGFVGFFFLAGHTHKLNKHYTSLLCMTAIFESIMVSLPQHVTYLFVALYWAVTAHNVLADLPAWESSTVLSNF